MGSLFVRPDPKRNRVCIMLGASLLLHGCLIGVAEMWTPLQPPEHSVDMRWEDQPESSGSGPVPLSVVVDTPEVSVPAPLVIDEAEATPVPPEEDPEIYEPASTPVPHRSVTSKPFTVARASRGLAKQNTGREAASSSAGASGSVNNGPATDATAWAMPHPAYPSSTIIRGNSSASTTVHIVTDATGHVSSVVITKSTGNSALDNYTEMYIRTHWHGPANASRNTEFVYQTR